VAKNSFRIRDGKLGKAVNETMISGNLADMLKNLGGVSAELVCSGSSVLPWVVFRNVLISGS
jgi:PmbA protein